MPTISNFDDLKKLRGDMETYFTGLHKEIRTDEKYYDLSFEDELDLPHDLKDQGVVLPTARTNVDTAVDHISAEARRIEVPARSSQPAATEEARKKQRFYESLLNWIDNQYDQSPFRQGVKRLAAIGIECWKFVPDPAPNRPRQKVGESEEAFKARQDEWRTMHATTMPFRLIPIHPMEVIFDPWNPTPKWAMHIKKMLAGEAMSIYRDWDNKLGRRLTDEVEVVEFWDDTTRAVMIDGSSALKNGEVVKHGWGTHPYIVGGSGYGIDDNTHRPDKRYVSINRFIRDILHSESRNYSVVDIVLKSQAWPIRIALGERANEVAKFQLEYGKIHPWPEGIEIKDLAPELPHELVIAHAARAGQIISEVAAPRAVRGLREAGTTSGIDQQTQLGEARLKYRPLARGVERMLEQVCVKAGIYMKHVIKEPVNIAPGAKTDEYFDVSPSLFNNPATVRVRVNVLDPEDEIRKKNAMAQELAAGTIDQLSAIEELHPDKDARKVQQAVVQDRLMFHPMIQNVIAGATAEALTQKLELAELLESALARIQQAEAASGVPAQGVTPPAESSGGVVRGSRADSAGRRVQEGRL